MNSNKGVLLFARNNGKLDYVKQAVYLANRIKKYLDLPVSVVTDSPDYLLTVDINKIVDKIITINAEESISNRRYYDGSMYSQVASFKNDARSLAYDLTPYDETLVLDTDFIVCNSILKNCFEMSSDFLVYKKSSDIAKVRDESEFIKVSDYSIDFYWATVIFFRKTELNCIFFNLVKHIQDEWTHYRRVYQLESPMFRNDYAFSIAIHIMNGFQQGDFVTELPGNNIYSTDKDLLMSIVNDQLTFLVEKKDYLGEYTLIKTKAQNIHVMNKFSLERVISSETTHD
jgi:hypothetical protein